MENLVFIIIFGLFLLVNALIKKAMSEDKSQKQQQGASTKSNSNNEYGASQKDLQDFLGQIKTTKKEAESSSSRRRPTTEDRSGQTSTHWASQAEAEEKSQRAEKIRREQKKRHKSRSETADSKRKKETMKTPKEASPKTASTKSIPKHSTLARAGGRQQKPNFELKPNQLVNAVVWSEILRPPISLRSERRESRHQIKS